MDSDGSFQTSPEIKQEEITLQPVGSTKKNSSGKKDNLAKKRNLVRWHDDLDKQVLLTLQWACNEIGVKIPWELVAKTMGNGITEGAIVQHLAKLRTKMIKAEISVPPTLRRGIVAKEPSKIYATSNGKKHPPPIFASPSTPTVKGTPKTPVGPKTPVTPKTKPKNKGKGKRRRSDFEDTDEDEIHEYVEDSDEDYGASKKRIRTFKSKPKGPATGKTSKARQADIDAATEEINGDILRALGNEYGGPATRTRHVKQDFSNIEETPTDEEDEEDENGSDGDFVTPKMQLSASFKADDSISPHTVPSNDVKVTRWSQGVTSEMLPPNYGSIISLAGNNNIQAYQRPMLTNALGLITPQTSRNASTASLSTSLLNTPASMSYGLITEQHAGYGAFIGNAYSGQDIFTPAQYSGFDSQLSTLNNSAGDLGFEISNARLDANMPALPADPDIEFVNSYHMNNIFNGGFNFNAT